MRIWPLGRCVPNSKEPFFFRLANPGGRCHPFPLFPWHKKVQGLSCHVMRVYFKHHSQIKEGKGRRDKRGKISYRFGESRLPDCVAIESGDVWVGSGRLHFMLIPRPRECEMDAFLFSFFAFAAGYDEANDEVQSVLQLDCPYGVFVGTTSLDSFCECTERKAWLRMESSKQKARQRRVRLVSKHAPNDHGAGL